MFGIDARAAMQPGGIVDGFSNLGQALLLDARQRRERQQQMAMHQQQVDFQNRQLAQALQIAQMQDARQRDQFGAMKQWHEDEIQRQQANDAARNGVAASNSARQWAGTIGTGMMNLGQALGVVPGRGSTHEFKPTEINPYKDVETVDPDSGKVIRTKQLKTDAEIQQEIHVRNALRGAVNGVAPKPDSATVAANKARSAQARADQRAQGLVQYPGDPKPTPSTAGVGESMPSDAQPQTPAPSAPPAVTGPKVMPRAILLQKADKHGISPEDAQKQYESMGYTIGD